MDIGNVTDPLDDDGRPSEGLFDVLQWLPNDVRTAFLRQVRVRRHDTGDVIYGQGDAGEEMFRLVSGSVRLSVARADGRELLYLLFKPGDCFGTSSCVDREPRPQTAEAASAVDVQVLSRAAFDRLRHDYREFDDALLRLMTRHMRLLSGFFADAHLTTLSARIASRIVANSRSFGVPGEAGTGFSVHLSQSDFALMVGASRQSVNKVLQRFQEDGLIVIEYGALVVRDLDRLQLRAAAP